MSELLTADGGHFWVPFGLKGHRCAFCAATAANPRQKRRHSLERCQRDLGQLRQVLEHWLWCLES